MRGPSGGAGDRGFAAGTRGGRRLARPRLPVRDHRAHDELELVEQHHRQHDQPDHAAGEQDVGHRQPGRQALLRAAEHDRGPVGLGEPQQPGTEVGAGQHRRQQRDLERGEHDELARRDPLPDPADHALAERGVDDEEDRSPVVAAQRGLVATHPITDPAAAELPEQERDQQLEHDVH